MRTRALIVHIQPTNEYDVLVTAYTQELGKVVAIAKSALKHTSLQAPHLDALNLVEFELVSGRGYPIITGAQLERGYRQLKASLVATAMGQVLAQIVDRVVFDYERDDELWRFLEETCDRLDQTNGAAPTVGWFDDRQRELLRVLGHPDPAVTDSAPSAAFEQLAQVPLVSFRFLDQMIYSSYAH